MIPTTNFAKALLTGWKKQQGNTGAESYVHSKAQCYQIVYAPMFVCQLDTLSPVDAALEMRSTLGDDNDGKMRTRDRP